MFQQQSDIILTVATSPIALSAFRREFLAIHEPPLSSKSTHNKYRQVLDELAALGLTSTDQITPEAVARFIQARPAGTSPHTTRSLLMHLRAIASYGEGRRYLTISPFRLRKLARWVRMPPPEVKRALTREEVRRVFDVMRHDVATKKGWAQWRARRLYAAAATVAYTGLRRNEALFLWVEDLRLEDRVIDLVPRGRNLPGPSAEAPRLKTEASALPIALPSALVPVLSDWLAHRLDHPDGFALPPADRIPWVFPGSRRTSAWSEGAPGIRPVERLQAAARRAGVEGITFQALRRTWASVAEASGIPQALITRQCRHTSEATTKRWYQRRDVDALREGVEGFDF